MSIKLFLESTNEYLMMPFGQHHSYFQVLMNDIFRSYIRKFVPVIFNDILVYNVDIWINSKLFSGC
jgi:hypothetical protein